MATDPHYLIPLKKATNRPSEGYISDPKDISDTQIQEGLIPQSEFTYELSHQMLKHFLEKPLPIRNNMMRYPLLIRCEVVISRLSF